VRAHIFICLLAYYVEWHMRKALRPMLFDDEQRERIRPRRDPVAPAKPSPSARKKKSIKSTSDGLPVHSFDTLLAELDTLCRNVCQRKNDDGKHTFSMMTQPSATQEKAFKLLEVYP